MKNQVQARNPFTSEKYNSYNNLIEIILQYAKCMQISAQHNGINNGEENMHDGEKPSKAFATTNASSNGALEARHLRMTLVEIIGTESPLPSASKKTLLRLFDAAQERTVRRPTLASPPVAAKNAPATLVELLDSNAPLHTVGKTRLLYMLNAARRRTKKRPARARQSPASAPVARP